MKKMKKAIYILAVIGLILGACDKIEEPYLVKTDGSGPAPGEKVRKIILEEITGHICVNCPEATLLANDLKQVFGEQLILLSIHAGDLAKPENAPFEADYRTPTGTALYNFFQFEFVPTGMVNRTPYGGGIALFKDSWEPAIQELIDLPPEVYIEIENTYNENTRDLEIHIHSEFLADLTKTCNLSVFIIESGIVSAQKNNKPDIGPTPIWADYEHNHILRSSLNGTWGDELVDQPTAGTIITKDYAVTLNTAWDAANCAIIALVLDAETNEVLQAEEMHIL
jgi:hypothetical protein